VGGSNKGNSNKASIKGRPAQAVTANQRASAKPSGNKTKVVRAAKVSDTVRAGQSMGNYLGRVLEAWGALGSILTD
jgi:hypothetical protein